MIRSICPRMQSSDIKLVWLLFPFITFVAFDQEQVEDRSIFGMYFELSGDRIHSRWKKGRE